MVLDKMSQRIPVFLAALPSQTPLPGGTITFCFNFHFTTIKRKMSPAALVSFFSFSFCFDVIYTLHRHKCSQN